MLSGIESSNGHPLVSYDDDDNIDFFWEDYADVDEYALLQAHLDNFDIPPGTEAFTWLPEYAPLYDTQSDAKNSYLTDSSQPTWSLEPSNSKIQGSTMGSSNLQIKMDNVGHSSRIGSSCQLFSQDDPSKKKSAASHCSGRDLNLSSRVAANPQTRKLLNVAKPPAATIFETAQNAASIKMMPGLAASFGSRNHGLAANRQRPESSSPQLFSQAAPSMNKSTASQCSGRDLNLSSGVAAHPQARKPLNAAKPPASPIFERSQNAAAIKMMSGLAANFGSQNRGLAANPQRPESSSQLFSQAAPNMNKSTASQCSGRDLNLSSGVAANPQARKLINAAKPPAATIFESAQNASGIKMMSGLAASFGSRNRGLAANPQRPESSSPQLFSQAAPNMNKSTASQCSGRGLNLSSGVAANPQFRRLLHAGKPPAATIFKSAIKAVGIKMKSASFGSKNRGLAANPQVRKLLHAGNPPAATKLKSAIKRDLIKIKKEEIKKEEIKKEKLRQEKIKKEKIWKEQIKKEKINIKKEEIRIEKIKKRDQERKDQERKDQERRDQERKDQERRDQERKEQDQERKDQDRKDQERRDQERREPIGTMYQERKDQERRNKERKDQERREPIGTMYQERNDQESREPIGTMYQERNDRERRGPRDTMYRERKDRERREQIGHNVN